MRLLILVFTNFPLYEVKKEKSIVNIDQHSVRLFFCAGEHFGRGHFYYPRNYTTSLQITLFDIPGMR